MRKTTNIILAFSVLFTFSIMIYTGKSYSFKSWIGDIGYFGWACLPYVIILIFNMIKRGNPRKDTAIVVTSIIVSGSAALILIDAFFIHLDAQNALIFLSLPGYQSIFSIAGGLIGLILYVRSEAAQPSA